MLNAAKFQFSTQTTLIDGFQESRPQNSVNLDCGPMIGSVSCPFSIISLSPFLCFFLYYSVTSVPPW